jgi:molecular chaperone GrpE
MDEPMVEAAGLDSQWGVVEGQLSSIEGQLAEFNRRAAHREAVIDRLHAENQELRAGLWRAALEPAVTDLIRLHDALTSEAARAGDLSGKMMRSFAADVELILDRCGIESFAASSGEPYQPGQHKPVGVIPTSDPEQDGTLAEVVAVGFRERDQGRTRRPLHARFYQYHMPNQQTK